MGNIVYVSNQKIVSDYNALQLELTHIIEMSLSNTTTVGQTTPATWQPPLPTYAPPPLPSSESISTTPASTPAVTQPFYVNYIDQSHLNPVRRLDSDPSFSTPTSTQFRDLSSVYGTPPYQNAQSVCPTANGSSAVSLWPAAIDNSQSHWEVGSEVTVRVHSGRHTGRPRIDQVIVCVCVSSQS